MLANAVGWETTTAAYTALGFSVVLLTVVGYIGARLADTPTRSAVVEGLGAGALGVVIMVAKSLLH